MRPDKVDKVRRLIKIAEDRGQSMAQFALAWVLRDPRITSALIGASRVAQIEDSLKALKNVDFSQEELDRIEQILKD